MKPAPSNAASRTRRLFRHVVLPVFSCLLMSGCVERTMTISTTPPGALVYLNDREVGRTPMTRDFIWYGDYGVTLRKEGYETLKTKQLVVAAWYEFVPLDLVAELLPFTFRDAKSYSFTLRPMQPVNPDELMLRAEELRAQTRPSLSPTTQPAKR